MGGEQHADERAKSRALKDWLRPSTQLLSDDRQFLGVGESTRAGTDLRRTETLAQGLAELQRFTLKSPDQIPRSLILTILEIIITDDIYWKQNRIAKYMPIDTVGQVQLRILSKLIRENSPVPDNPDSLHYQGEGTVNTRPFDPLVELWFEHDPSPRWIVTRKLDIVTANAQARRVTAGGHVLTTTNNTLGVVDEGDGGRLKRVISEALWGNSAITVLRGTGTERPGALTVRVFGDDTPGGPYLALSLNEARDFLSPEALSGALDLFELTPAEKAIVQSLFESPNTEITSRSLGLSPHTVNAHLRRIFRKMGCNSKSDVILTVIKALTASPRPEPPSQP